MTISIRSNSAASMVQRGLSRATDRLSAAQEKLSSGMRINRASDDPAGLAISASLNTDSRIFSQGIRNLNDGVSALTIADEATGTLSSILTRLKELAIQSANGSYSRQQRNALNAEAQAIRDEFNRVIATTEFNDVKLIDGSSGQLVLQGGGNENQLKLNIDQAATFAHGDGTFAAGVTVSSTHNGVSAIFIEDFSSDGNKDILSFSYISRAIYLEQGNGDGSFKAPTYVGNTQYGSGGSPQVADINKDGKLDFVTDNGFFDRMDVWLGNGNGTFQLAQSPYTANGATDIQLVDLDRDGHIDIVSANPTENRLRIAYGNGNGTFRASVSVDVGIAPAELSFGDFNNDGRGDLAMASKTGSFRMFMANSDGSWAVSGSFSAPVSINEISSADLDDDGNLDLVLVSESEATVSIYKGTGDGSFKSRETYALTTASYDLKLVDLNGDLNRDIIVSDDQGVDVLLANSDGSFKAKQNLFLSGQTYAFVNAVGDVNNDGAVDIFAGWYAGTGFDHIVKFMGNGSNDASLANFRLTTRQNALDSLSVIDSAFDRLSIIRGKIGAQQSRIQSSLSTLATAREGYKAAASRITDAEVAQEVSAQVQAQVTQQVAVSLLAQANQMPALALQLLR